MNFNTEAVTSSSQNVVVSKKLVDYCLNPSDLAKLDALSSKESRQILPFLTRLWKRSSLYTEDDSFADFKLAFLEKLRLFEDTNRICAYLDADFTQIYDDVIRHLSARKKSQSLSAYNCSDFEAASPTAKLLMISNVLLNGNIRTEDNINCKYSLIDYSLFDLEIYFQDLSDILCIIHAELGEVISLSQFVYTLLHAQGNLCVHYILNLMANSVDCVFQIVDIIIEGCSCSTQIDIQRHKCLLAICSCWPSLTCYVISECIRRHILPSVILFLSLSSSDAVVSRENNLPTTLLSILQFENDRNWFVQFLRSPNKNLIEKQSVDMIREELITLCYKAAHGTSATDLMPHLDLQLFKIYSGLRHFAGLKFNDLEVKALIELILNTSEITVAISFLFIYPPIYEHDMYFQRIVQWIKEKFEKAKQSILLIAIYCNSSQIKVAYNFKKIVAPNL